MDPNQYPPPPPDENSADYASISYQKGLTFLNLNVRSLLPKIDIVRHLVHEANPEVVGITETWLHEGVQDSEISIPNYILYRLDRTENDRVHGAVQHGGVALYIKSRKKNFHL